MTEVENDSSAEAQNKIRSLLDLSQCPKCATKTFLIGIGAQRSGTTWISRYLEKHPDISFSPIKELHVFDSLILRKNNQIESHFAKRVMSMPPPKSDLELDLYSALSDRLASPYIQGGYFRFFEKRLNHSHHAFGEITPEYALLPSESYKTILDSHPDTRFLYILRDPCERYISALSYWARLRPEFDVKQNMIKSLKRDLFVRYSLYHHTISKILDVTPRTSLKVVFMEELFSNTLLTLHEICSFLGIRHIASNMIGVSSNKRVNPTETNDKNKPTQDEYQIIRDKFADVYSSLPDLIGRKLPEKWGH